MAAIVKATVELMGDETMSVELPNGKGPGKWQRIIIDEFGDHPRWSAIIRCPECKVFLPIPNHTISADGQVTPSVGHDPKWPACSWHPTPKLIGWAPCPPRPGAASNIRLRQMWVEGTPALRLGHSRRLPAGLSGVHEAATLRVPVMRATHQRRQECRTTEPCV